MSEKNTRSGVGLRERKKNKTKAAIQQIALEIFNEQGYENTTIDQIAEAAEISRATFFWYFPTKADLIINDVFDSKLLRAYQSQAKNLNPIKALRISLHSILRDASVQDLEFEKQREAFLRQVPELRTALNDILLRALPVLTKAIGEHINRPEDDIGVRTLAGAVIGVTIAIWETIPIDSVDYMRTFLEQLDAGYEYLEAYFPL